ncbi:effector-associated constant component EACC1 [Streptomyces sp. NPDC001156]
MDITVTRPDGRSVEIKADQAKDADALIREALRESGDAPGRAEGAVTRS